MRRQGEKTLVHLKYDIVSFIQVSNPGHPRKKNEARIVVVKRRRRTFYALDATFWKPNSFLKIIYIDHNRCPASIKSCTTCSFNFFVYASMSQKELRRKKKGLEYLKHRLKHVKYLRMLLVNASDR